MPAAALNLPQRVLTALVRGYRLLLGPWLGNACRFEPTCSVYSIKAIETHGAAIGVYMTLHRLARCHPWCQGGHDPVPGEPPAVFRHLVAATAPGAGSASSPSTDKTSP